MALNKNFRTTYYKTLGVPVLQHVDVEASFSALLCENVVNVKQIVKLAMEFGIPPADRPVVWLLMAGVLPPYKSIWEFVSAEKKQIFMDLTNAAKALIGSLSPPSSPRECARHRAPDTSSVVLEEQTQRMVEDSEQQELPHDGDKEEIQHSEHSQNQQSAKVQLHDESNHKNLQRIARTRLIALHQLYWCSILGEESLHCMDNTTLLDALLSHIQQVVQEESDQFWCFVRFLQLLDQGLEVVEPQVPLESFAEMTTTEFEALLLRVVDTMNAI